MSVATANMSTATTTTTTAPTMMTKEEARWALIEQDREHKKQLVLDSISEQCRVAAASNTAGPPSSSPVVIGIGHALNNNTDSLEIEVLSGGLTNYSYKLRMRSNPSIALFAKISFPYALWNPDPSQYYDVERTLMEYQLMKRVHPILGEGVVPIPYFCLDISDNSTSSDESSSTPESKLLVTEWSKADEQWSHQLIEGRVDARIAPKVGRALANLHCLPVHDPNHNTKAARSDCMKGSFGLLESRMEQLLQDPSSMFPTLQTSARSYEQAVRLAKSNRYSEFIEKSRRNYLDDRECLIHSDAHVFNILVEDQESGGDNMTLCDWEMALVGPLGRDNGYFQPFPIICALGHALIGNLAAANQALGVVENVREAYEDTLRANGRSEEHIRYTLQQSVAWTGWFGLLANYFFTFHPDFLPFFDETTNERELHRDACGVLFFRLLELGFEDGGRGYEELESSFQSIIKDEIDRCSKKHSRAPRRRSSMAAFRRLSDTVLHCTVAAAAAAASADLPDLSDDK